MRTTFLLIITTVWLSACSQPNDGGNEARISEEGMDVSEAQDSTVDSGDEFVGIWSQQTRDPIIGGPLTVTIHISRNGQSFLVTVSSDGRTMGSQQLNGTYPATLQNGVLQTNSQLGDIGSSPDQNAIFVKGTTFTRTAG